MSKEFIRPEQFGQVDKTYQDSIKLSPEQAIELEELYNSVSSKIKTGELVKGTILSIGSDSVLIDIQYKSDGSIPKYEFSEHELKELKSGSSIDVILDELESADGSVSLSYEKAKALKAWDAITKLFEDDKPVEGTVTRTVKGGLSVDIGVPAFLPGSQVDTQRVTNFEDFIGQTITANIIKINKKRGNVIISRRKYLSEKRAELHEELMKNIKEGQVVQGVAKNIAKYGVFVDIGGVDGLLHITDMTWGRISHPSKMVKIGDTISVQILSVDHENNKISLGMKQLSENPWQKIDSVNIGSKVKGRISSIADYGLFVEIADGVEGLVHISEVSWTERIADLNNKFTIGDEIEATVVSLDKENRRLSLSIRQLADNPWQSVGKDFAVDQKITGIVSNITDFGIFIQITPGVDGLAHISDLSWTRHIEHPRDLYEIGKKVEAVILSIDQDAKKVSLGIKQLSSDPWQTIDTEYPINSIVDGEVSKITNFGMFVKLPNKIEGFVHISELEKDGKKPEDLFKAGDKAQFRISAINKEDRKIALSTDLEATSSSTITKSSDKKSKSSKSSSSSKPVKTSSTSKVTAKSAFQLALEKHANEDK